MIEMERQLREREQRRRDREQNRGGSSHDTLKPDMFVKDMKPGGSNLTLNTSMNGVGVSLSRAEARSPFSHGTRQFKEQDPIKPSNGGFTPTHTSRPHVPIQD